MSAENVTTIIRRAVAEQEFRTALFQNPNAALSGYELTDEERSMLTKLTAENFDATAGEMEARISKSGIVGLDTEDFRSVQLYE